MENQLIFEETEFTESSSPSEPVNEGASTSNGPVPESIEDLFLNFTQRNYVSHEPDPREDLEPQPGPSQPPNFLYSPEEVIAMTGPRSPSYEAIDGIRLLSVRTSRLLRRLIRARATLRSTRPDNRRSRNSRSDRILSVIDRIASRHLEVKRIKEENKRRKIALEEKKVLLDQRLERIEHKLDLILAKVSKANKKVSKN